MTAEPVAHGTHPKPRSDEKAGLYVHVPFCSAICPYCDFAVLVGGPERRAAFLDSLIHEIDLVVADGPPPGYEAGFDTLYLGGGTPSALTAVQLERLLRALRQAFQGAPDARVFLEANPEDVDEERLAAWRALGVATLSLGVQSFVDRELVFLGRRHGAVEARRSVELALGSGIETISIDLIYGLPGQALGSWQSSLETALHLAPHHLSCYELEIHQGTPFGKQQQRGELAEASDDVKAEHFFLTHRFLEEAGYPAYEVSNFARAPERRSRHNQKYWHHVPYLGLGPSAHSFDGQRRFWNERHLSRWQAAIARGELPRTGAETLALEDMALEALMLGLRTREGVDLALFKERFGVDLLAVDRGRVERWITDGYLRHEAGRVVPTVAGLAVADSLAASWGEALTSSHTV